MVLLTPPHKLRKNSSPSIQPSTPWEERPRVALAQINRRREENSPRPPLSSSWGLLARDRSSQRPTTYDTNGVVRRDDDGGSDGPVLSYGMGRSGGSDVRGQYSGASRVSGTAQCLLLLLLLLTLLLLFMLARAARG